MHARAVALEARWCAVLCVSLEGANAWLVWRGPGRWGGYGADGADG